MGRPKITENNDYDENGRKVVPFRRDEYPSTRSAEDFKRQYLGMWAEPNVEPNPYNRATHQPTKLIAPGQPPQLKYEGMLVTDTVVMGQTKDATWIRLALHNGERALYACHSADELEWIADGLGMSLSEILSKRIRI